jgi:hypothetical protein
MNFDKIGTDYKVNQDGINGLVQALSYINNLLMAITMSLNYLGLSIAESSKLPKELYESIEDLETMDRFVKAMTDNNFASIDIKNFIYAAASPKLNGKGTAENPIWGQTRVVFFPTNTKQFVYKIGFNRYGAFANITEEKISKMCTKAEKQYNVRFPIAKTFGLTKNNIVERMQRVSSTGKELQMIDGLTFSTNLNLLAHKCKLPITFIDIHYQNIAEDEASGEVLCFDYGDVNYNTNI